MSTTPESAATRTADRPTTAGPRPSARERLLAAADELFYAEGVHIVGIDRIIEHAGVAKASLYSTFGSKEALVGAYLDARRARSRARLERAVARRTDPRERLLAIFDAQAELMAEPGFHGCAFANASAEAEDGDAAYTSARTHRTWMHDLVAGLATDAGASDPDLLARQLLVVYDGANLAYRMECDTGAATLARRTGEAVVDAALRASA